MRILPRHLIILCVVALSSGDLVHAADPPEGTFKHSPGAAEPTSPSQWYGDTIRPTEARSPDEERAGFHLPDGFEIELVAAEPHIAKPLNMAFDAAGRLWLSDTVEYPFPVTDDNGRDSIKVISDTTGDGEYDRVHVFADRLNIPMGLLPYGDGVIAFSIPNLWYLRDTDGDGVCDQREVILGPFDTTRDTHGMVNALRRGYDGWIYACHGFSNQSVVNGRDGWQVEMTSGNTFRFRPDGERIEHITHGQVNPFGMTFDGWGNLFSADCHSKPITQLVRGGYYSSFGRPDDGLGFIPSMMDHLHGSTAIAGLVLYDADQFPVDYRQQFYSGNVMTCRINRNVLVKHGATYKAVEAPDFLTSDDPWFRPVDLQLAPDGSLFVADFYNRIIGHYEVPLTHEGRDRHRGRIWRIFASRDSRIPQPINDRLSSPNTSLRLATLNQLADAATLADQNIPPKQASVAPIVITPEVLASLPKSGEKLWLDFRLQKLAPERLVVAMHSDDPRTRVHAASIAAEQERWTDTLRTAVTARLDDEEALVVRAAAEALGRHPESNSVDPLIARLIRVDPTDVILKQSLRIAIRDTLKHDSNLANALLQKHIGKDSLSTVVSILLGLPSEAAGRALCTYLLASHESIDTDLPYAKHALRTLSISELDVLLSALKARSDDSRAARAWLTGISSIAATSGEAKSWASDWARTAWEQQISKEFTKVSNRVEWKQSTTAESWPMQTRASSDASQRQYMSSAMLGESYVGTLMTSPFLCESTLSFWIAGHDGPPNKPAGNKNYVRLIDTASGTTLRQAAVPRSDTGTLIRWDLEEYRGQSVYVEAVDGNAGNAYAWLALGSFSDARLAGGLISDEIDQWSKIVTDYRVAELLEPLRLWAKANPEITTAHKLKILSMMTYLASDPTGQAVVDALEISQSRELLDRWFDRIASGTSTEIETDWIKRIAIDLSYKKQLKLAEVLSRRRETLPGLLSAVKNGWIAAASLKSKPVQTAFESLAEEPERKSYQESIANLPSENEALAEVVSTSLAKYLERGGDPATGDILFQKHCAACHQMAGKGALVGPQLDGVGGRGPQRLLEDLIYPDRNVDAAFRTTSFVLEDGTVHVGLIRMETAETIEIVESDGQVKRLDADSVELRRATNQSLMPTGLHDAIGLENIQDLLTYLIQSSRP